MLKCSANFHSRSAQSSLAQGFLSLGFVQQCYCLTAYHPFKAKNVSNVFQDPIENTCVFPIEALCYIPDHLKINTNNTMECFHI